MARCRSLVVPLVALAASGCVTGHAFDLARRRERVVAYREAWRDGGRLVVGYTAQVTDDAGTPRGEAERWAAIDLAALPAAASGPVCAVPVEPLRSFDGPGRHAEPVHLEVAAEDERAVAFTVPGSDAGPVSSEVFTRVTTAPWVWPLLPVTLAVDAATTPPLLLLAPAVILLGD